jgi:hypothetical protein
MQTAVWKTVEMKTLPELEETPSMGHGVRKITAHETL